MGLKLGRSREVRDGDGGLEKTKTGNYGSQELATKLEMADGRISHHCGS